MATGIYYFGLSYVPQKLYETQKMKPNQVEMYYEDDIPNNVAINEAVELAKKYSGDEAPAFINGLLGNVIKGIKE